MNKKPCNCKKKKEHCNCRKETVTYSEPIHIPCDKKEPLCGHKNPCFLGCSCNKCEPLCPEPEDKCKEPCTEYLFDFKEIAYKVRCDTFPNKHMEALGFRKGTRLESVIEELAKLAYSQQYLLAPTYGSIEFESVEDIFNFIIKKNKDLEENLLGRDEYIESLERRIDKLERLTNKFNNPEFSDKNGLEIFKTTTTLEAIQVLINNTIPNE